MASAFIFCGILTSINALWSGVLLAVEDLPVYLRDWAPYVTPAYYAVGAITFTQLDDRNMDCEALEHPSLCSNGEEAIKFIGLGE